MASYVPCKKNDANGYIFYVSLVSQADVKIFQANPTYAAGDIQVAIDDGAPANVSAVAIDGDFTKRVKITLSQAQTNGDNLTVICSDAAGSEWCDLTVNIQTAAQTLDEMDVNIDDIETDTDEIQGKLPTNKFMGSSDGADDDGTLNTIAGDVVNLDGAAMYSATMRGTDSAALASSWTAALATALGNYNATRAGYLDQLDFNLNEAIAAIPTTAMRGTDNASTHNAAAVWAVGTREITGGTVATATDVTNDVGITQGGADKVWGTTARTLSAATNITSTGNAVGLHTDDKVLLAQTTHTSSVIPTVTTTGTATAVTNDVGITQTGADKVWGTTTRVLTANTNLNDPTAAAISTAVWGETARILTAATNITSTGNAVGLHTDDKVLLAQTTHTSAVIPTVTTTGTATAVTNDVGITQTGADKVWSSTTRVLSAATNLHALITDYDLDHLMSSALPSPAVTDIDAQSALGFMMNKDGNWTGWDRTTDSGEGNADAAGGATAAEVWAYGTRVLSANTNLNDPTAATISSTVWAETTRALTDKDDFNLATDQSGVTIGTVTDVTETFGKHIEL